jgi:N-acetylglucosamine-6-phosphate deacetylase
LEALLPGRYVSRARRASTRTPAAEIKVKKRLGRIDTGMIESMAVLK